MVTSERLTAEPSPVANAPLAPDPVVVMDPPETEMEPLEVATTAALSP